MTYRMNFYKGTRQVCHVSIDHDKTRKNLFKLKMWEQKWVVSMLWQFLKIFDVVVGGTDEDSTAVLKSVDLSLSR